MGKEEILHNLENVTKKYLALFIKDSTLDIIHYYIYNPSESSTLLDKIKRMYNNNLEYGDKQIIAVLQTDSFQEINDFYDSLDK